RVTAAREREQKERQRIHCRHRPYNRQRSERTHLSNLLRYREPQGSSRRLKLAIHRFLKTGFCNAVPLAVLVMLGSVLPALRVPPGEFRPIYRHCHSYPFLHASQFGETPISQLAKKRSKKSGAGTAPPNQNSLSMIA